MSPDAIDRGRAAMWVALAKERVTACHAHAGTIARAFAGPARVYRNDPIRLIRAIAGVTEDAARRVLAAWNAATNTRIGATG